MTWRNLSFVLAAVCVLQAWRGCHQRLASVTTAATECTATQPSTRTFVSGEARPDEPTAPLSPTGPSLGGFVVPSWAAWLAPQPGESLLAYRDRVVPIAQAAIAPHRARVARGRDDFARLASLDPQQRAQLDNAAREAATAIEDRLIGAVMAGELAPAMFKPMTGISLARDVLDTIDQANRRFVTSLRDDQRAALAKHPFDFADYLLFSTRWEDALGVTE